MNATTRERARWAQRALRDAGIEVTRDEAERGIIESRERERARTATVTPLWCGACGIITAHTHDQTLCDRCSVCGQYSGGR